MQMAVDEYGGIDNLEVLVEAKRYNRFLVDAIVDAGRGCGSALDFGAGTGSISRMVRERGIDVICVELDPALRDRLHDLGFTVYADIDAVGDDSQTFVYSLNVLEHIDDDEGTLTHILPRMTPGGRFLVYVPALQWLYSSMDRKIGHYRRYHRHDFVRMAERAGYRVERAEYADSLGVLATLAYKLVGSRRGDISLASVRFYDRFLFPISRLLDRMGCSRLFGKNLLVVLERPGGSP
jgi:SAM-dependent methyltransferase